MQHDSTGNSCPASGFIMNAVITTTPTQFSSCSQDYYNQFINSYTCLENVPTTKWGKPVCGNGFVEQGEQCDCGPPSTCTDPCCNAKTCMLSAIAQCSASDPCCTGCQIITNTTTQCRPSSGFCDVAEYCDGVHGSCPPDWFVGAGVSCNLTDYNDVGECYLGGCLSYRKQCVDDSSGLTTTALLECSVDQQKAYNDGNFCGSLFCEDTSQGTCVFLTVSGQTDQVDDGIPCDSGSQCLKGTCEASQLLQPQFYWLPSDWSSCDTCETPQTRTVSCFYQDPTINPPPAPRLIDDIYCSVNQPPSTQTCDNVTLGCVDTSFLSSNSINFFGFTVQKYALVLIVLGVFALVLVVLAGCYKAVTYQSGKMANPRVRHIGDRPKANQVQPLSHAPKQHNKKNSKDNSRHAPGQASPQLLNVPISARNTPRSQQHQQHQHQQGQGSWVVDPNGEYEIEYT